MSRAQWGHGYHTGANKKKQTGYVGLWFFTTTEDKLIQYQGQIKRRMSKDSFAVQHHDWIMGEANGPLVIVSLDDLKTYHLFESGTDLRYGIHKYQMQNQDLYPNVSQESFDAWESMLERIYTEKPRSKKKGQQ